MSVTANARQAFERVTGRYLLSYLPRGVRLEEDLSNHLPNTAIRTIFDVGANVGQSAEQYLRHFPDADIHCFEPSKTTFRQLERNLRGRATLHRMGFAAAPGVGHITVDGPSEMRSLIHSAEAATEEVELQTLDGFCESVGIQQIDFLKIDTEGYDLEVLKGAKLLLQEQRIAAIQVEAGMHPRNDRHVPFELLKSHLEEQDYLLFAIYEQAGEWTSGGPHLRRTNPVFISDRAILENSNK